MKIRAGFLIDYEVSGLMEAAEVEKIIDQQMNLIIKNDPRVVHFSSGAKARRDSKAPKPKFTELK